jgi:hypothetical protein
MGTNPAQPSFIVTVSMASGPTLLLLVSVTEHSRVENDEEINEGHPPNLLELAGA